MWICARGGGLGSLRVICLGANVQGRGCGRPFQVARLCGANRRIRARMMRCGCGLQGAHTNPRVARCGASER